jgi:hypothetical protein
MKADRMTILLGLAVVGALGLLAVQGYRAITWSDQLKSSVTRSAQVHDQVRLYERLSTQSETSLFGAPPDADVQAAVVEVLRSIGLPERSASSIRREADRPAGNDPSLANSRIREIRIELAALNPSELGHFINVWREQQPAWRIDRIVLRKSTARNSDTADYDVSLTCAARYTDTRSTP